MSSSSSDKKRILFIPLLSQGHVNFAISISKRFLQLYKDQCDIHFAVNEEFKNKLEQVCQDVKYNVYGPTNQPKPANNEDRLAAAIQELGDKCWKEDPVEMMVQSAPMLDRAFERLKENYEVLSNIVKQVQPNLIIFDQIFSMPVGIDQGIKHAHLFSTAMNFAGLDDVVPPESGLPTQNTEENRKLWNDFVDKAYISSPFKGIKDKVSNWMKEKGCDDLDDHYFILKPSPYLNIYGYPKELDYTEDGVELPGKWIRIDSPIFKPYPQPFKVPAKLKNLSGKLIYFSLGTVVSMYEPLMQKVIDILSQLNHRFIISLGKTGDKYKLADNQYGEKYLDQFSVLRTVDMVISHGGNNTLLESFHFQKPLIILPVYGDQLDNAQRVHEKGLGRRCNIFGQPDKLKKEIEDAIEYCSLESVAKRMNEIGERIQNDSNMDNACKEILDFVNNL